MNVLSLFDGMSCGQVALERAGIQVNNYYASEIDKHAISITQRNYPNTEQLGSVLGWREWELPQIDLLIGGSPCQGFSIAGKQLAFDDPRSKLFFEYVECIKKFKPRYFLLENVRMKKEFLDVITEYMGVEPICINSNLVSAQNRVRYYWTNIPNVTQPDDLGILLKDIIHEGNPNDALSNGWIDWWKQNAEFQLQKQYSTFTAEKAGTMTARQYANWNGNFWFEALNKYIVPFDKTLQILDREVQRGKVGYFRSDSQANRVYYIHDKAVTLCGDAGGGAAKMGQYLIGAVSATGCAIRNQVAGRGVEEQLNVRTDDKSNAVVASYGDKLNLTIFGCITPDRVEKRQNGQRFSDGQKFYTLTAQDRHGVLVEGYIRKLSPVECERLQTLPDNYTAGVSDSQRYKMLGNGWTVDVIAHIFKGLK